MIRLIFICIVFLLPIVVPAQVLDWSEEDPALYWMHRNPDSARHYAAMANHADSLYRLRMLSQIQMQAGRYDLVGPLLADFLAVAKARSNDDALVWHQIDLGTLYLRQAKLEQADSMFKAVNIQSAHQQCELWVSAALHAWMSSQLEEATELAYRCIALSDSIGDSYNKARAWNMVYLVLSNQNEFEKAAMPLRQSMAINQANGYSESLVVNWLNEGLRLREKDSIAQAIARNEQAIALADSLGFTMRLAQLQNNLADIYHRKGDYQKALDLKLPSLAINETLGFVKNEMVACNTIGDAYFELGDYSRCIAFSHRGLKLAHQLNNERQKYYSYQQLSKSYEQLGQMVKSLEFLKMALASRSALLSEQLNDRVAHFQELYESEKAKQALLESERALELSAERAKRSRLSFVLIIIAMLLTGGVVFGFWYMRRSRLERAQQKRFAEELILAEEGERQRIAKDLHDGVGQQLALVKNALQAPQPKGATTQMVQETIDELRLISRNLMPVELASKQIDMALEGLVERVQMSSDVFITHEIDSLPFTLSDSQKVNLYRIAQESINNALRHGQASAIKLSLVAQGKLLKLQVQDNGIGFVPEDQNEGVGLRSLYERSKLLNGTFRLKSAPGKGTTCTCKIPIE